MGPLLQRGEHFLVNRSCDTHMPWKYENGVSQPFRVRTKAIRGLGGSQGISGGMGRRKPSLFPRLMNGRETTMLTDFNKEHCKFEISMVGTVPR